MSAPLRTIKAVLFDLDGTLLDTAADIGSALNAVLKAQNRPALTPAQVRSYTGKGATGLLRLGLQVEKEDPQFARLSEEFLGHYEKCLLETTQLFAGMEVVLQTLDDKNIPWGIVTNKPHLYTMKIVEGLLLHHRAKCIISGDTLKNSKPHPEPILHACKLLNVNPSECLYIGDAEIDMMASLAAGVTPLAALYGYIPDDENPQTWNAHGYINKPIDILTWLML